MRKGCLRLQTQNGRHERPSRMRCRLRAANLRNPYRIKHEQDSTILSAIEAYVDHGCVLLRIASSGIA